MWKKLSHLFSRIPHILDLSSSSILYISCELVDLEAGSDLGSSQVVWAKIFHREYSALRIYLMSIRACAQCAEEARLAETLHSVVSGSCALARGPAAMPPDAHQSASGRDCPEQPSPQQSR